ncbi:MAG: hypothetical protein P4L87_17350 [Formivibrio sp.]|nr:hypothetical protein [Formivibrio sp.]
MTVSQIELGISPLSTTEMEQALAALCRAWHQPAWINRQACGDAWLLAIRHEAELRPGESPLWFSERIAAALWQAVGRYVRITLALSTQESDIQLTLNESDYQRILRDFRLSPTVR